MFRASFEALYFFFITLCNKTLYSFFDKLKMIKFDV